MSSPRTTQPVPLTESILISLWLLMIFLSGFAWICESC
jgi:hypothetical protein